MTFEDAFRRAAATFVAGATAVPLSSAAFDVSWAKAMGLAGFVAVWNLVGRWAQTVLRERY